MPEASITDILSQTGAIGAGIWFADKVLSPSSGAIGEQLKAYLQGRCPIIFGRSGELAKERNVEPGPIKPGLLARLIMDASFSDDSDEITEWWANLILDASLSGSNQHAVFSDIMALMGPAEARCLQMFIESFPSCADNEFGRGEIWMDTLESKFEGTVEAWLGQKDLADRHSAIIINFLSGDPSWPMRPTEWRTPFKNNPDEEGSLVYGHDPRYTQNLIHFDILKRLGILTQLDTSFSVWGGSIWVKGIGLTPLGYEFYRSCTGRRPIT
jgi:hypothetical protein